jgi:hypothetical protein
MNSIERRVRDVINPYSTAFARWWCHSGRYMRLSMMITGHKAAGARRSGPASPSVPGRDMNAGEAHPRGGYFSPFSS